MLGVLSLIYGKIARSRNALYDRGVFETHDLGARTVSIGNITTGGTGKTPLVAYVAELLAANGEKVCILTRGYGRVDPKTRVLVSDGENILDDAAVTGDEPLELAHKLKERSIVIADADRVAAAEWAKRRFGVTAFVLDDGFQHRRAGRDLDIVCIDATKPLGKLSMLPKGRMREPLSGLARADAILLTRADFVQPLEIEELRREIGQFTGEVPIFEAANRLVKFIDLRTTAEANIDGKTVFAFCGLGDPENFFASLRRIDVDIRSTLAFGDHHQYSVRDITTIEAKAAGCAVLVTTAKDAVKLREFEFSIPCYVAVSEVAISDAEAFERLVIGD